MIEHGKRSNRLRTLIDEGVVMMPGAFNALSARMIEQAQFNALYLSGAVLAKTFRINNMGNETEDSINEYLGLLDQAIAATRLAV